MTVEMTTRNLTTSLRIKKIAIANRGEVAVRIIHAAQELGIKTLLLHSEVDTSTRAYRLADETACVGPAATAESYLRIDRNVEAALKHGADAIHPGFGFLSENADFAQAVVKAGMIFVGPKAETIRQLGDKISAKKIIERAGVPTVPGYAGDKQDLPTLIAMAEKIGFPVIVKAAAGGGGRGMKVIQSRGEASELISSAQREAKSSFGSEVVFLEKYLDRAKHIEFQVFGDSRGRVVHLFERECSVQRRHQKIIEESLAARLSEDLRAQMSKAAVQLAETAGYNGAGTVEFLVQDGKFYFLEMNTRLQVEHPVTEMLLGVDLVKAQILTAAGEFELWPQASLHPRGHSIECRVYAEDPYNRGLPSTGELVGLHWPEGPGRRFEVGIESGDHVTSYYDPMIAKVIVWDETRSRAIEKMLQVLRETIIFGVKTNIPYLQAILSHADFVSGQMTTQFIGNYFPEGLKAVELSELETKFAAFAIAAASATPRGQSAADPLQIPWSGPWRNV